MKSQRIFFKSGFLKDKTEFATLISLGRSFQSLIAKARSVLCIKLDFGATRKATSEDLREHKGQ